MVNCQVLFYNYKVCSKCINDALFTILPSIGISSMHGSLFNHQGAVLFFFFSFWWGSGAQLTSNEVICIDKGVSYPRGQWIILGLWVDLCNVK